MKLPKDAHHLISFIIPAHNEEILLPGCLVSLNDAAIRCGFPYEVLVVNDASTDQTGVVAAQYGATMLPVEHKHIAATRNAGARASKGDVLIFVDADTWVSPELLGAAMQSLQGGSVGGGAAIRLYGQPKWSERVTVRFLSWAFRLTKIAPGCFIFCTREAFQAVNGFDETLYAAEDVAISKALDKHGRFDILQQWATTSDRKMRTHGIGAHLRLFGRFFLRGWAVLRDRDDLGLWYGDRRHS